MKSAGQAGMCLETFILRIQFYIPAFSLTKRNHLIGAMTNLYKGPSIKYERKVFRKTNISNPMVRTHQRVRNVSFSENFAHVLNG